MASPIWRAAASARRSPRRRSGLAEPELGQELAAELVVVVLAGVDDASLRRRAACTSGATLIISGRVPSTKAMLLGAKPRSPLLRPLVSTLRIRRRTANVRPSCVPGSARRPVTPRVALSYGGAAGRSVERAIADSRRSPVASRPQLQAASREEIECRPSGCLLTRTPPVARSAPRSSTPCADVLDSGTLTATKGAFTKRLEAALAELLGVEHVVACASGSAAVHVGHRRARPRAGRRGHHHVDHRHGRPQPRSSTRAPSRSSPTSTRSP